MTGYYLLKFDDFWAAMLPNKRYRDYSEQLLLNVVNFDDGLTNQMIVDGTMVIRHRMPP